MAEAIANGTAEGLYNIEAEQGVCGAVLLNGAAYAVARHILQPGDFYLLRHTYIWEACEQLYSTETPIDYLTLTDRLRQNGRLADLDNGAYLTQIAGSTPTATYIRVYAELVKRDALRRDVLETADRIKAAAASDDALELALDNARASLASITRKVEHDASISIGDAAMAHFDTVTTLIADRKANPDMTLGVPSGIYRLDALLDGWLPADITTISGVTGTGKTALTFSMVINAARAGKKIGLFSGEMSLKATMDRLIANAAGIDSQRLAGGYLNKTEYTALARVVEEMREWKLSLWDNTRVGVGGLEAWVRRLRDTDACDVLFIDGYNEIDNYRNNREKRWDYSDIMNSLEELANKLELPIVGTHQLSRAAYGVEPMLNHLSESASVEQKSARVLMLWWESGARIEDGRLPAKLKIAKNRHGAAVGKSVDLWFHAAYTRYEGQEKAPAKAQPILLPDRTEPKPSCVGG